MKKVLLALMICSIMIVSGCNKQNEPKLPKSIQTYQKLNLTEEQNKKLADIRAEQRKKIDEIRAEIESKRKTLLDVDANKKLTDEQKRLITKNIERQLMKCV